MSTNTNNHPSKSPEQGLAEAFMVQQLSQQLNIDLVKASHKIDDAIVELDAFGSNSDRCVIGEAFARLQKLKSGQKRKILADALKLAFVGESLRQSAPEKKVEAYLIFASEEAKKAVTGDAWAASALRRFGIEALVFELPEPLGTQVEQAQKRQATGHHSKK